MNKYMQYAFEEARKGMRCGKGGPFGAVVVKDGKILCMASNEVLSSKDPTAHAEVTAIRRVCQKLKSYDLSGCVLYATGEPCPMCLSAIVWANIKTVYYASAACEAEKIGFRDSMIYRHLRGEEQILEILQIDSEEGPALYEEYRQMGNMIY
jgi:guanine deaminase